MKDFQLCDIISQRRNSFYVSTLEQTPLIPQFSGMQLVCAQADLFSNKPVSKKCGNGTFYVRRMVCVPSKGFGKRLAQHFVGLKSIKSGPAKSKKGFYTSHPLKNQGLRVTFNKQLQIFTIAVNEQTKIFALCSDTSLKQISSGLTVPLSFHQKNLTIQVVNKKALPPVKKKFKFATAPF